MFIADYADAHGGVIPTLAEMAEGAGISAKSGVYTLLERLEESGHIMRSRSARDIKILEMPFRTGPKRALWHLRKSLQHLTEEDGYRVLIARHSVESAIRLLEKKSGDDA